MPLTVDETRQGQGTVRLDIQPARAVAACVDAGDETMRCCPITGSSHLSIAGIYASSYGPRRLDVQADRSLTLSSFVNGQWHPSIGGLRLRQDGFFVAEQRPEVAYRLFAAAGRRYLAVRRPCGLGHYRNELPDSHDLSPGPPLSSRWQARAGQRWLMVNDPYSTFWPWAARRPFSNWRRSRVWMAISPLW